MPELPDVEALRQYLEANALDRRISGVVVTDTRILADLTPARFSEALTGGRLNATRRHGKHLLARLDRGGWLTMHFGMTGDLAFYADAADAPPYSRVILDFAEGDHLAYTNKRMLGRVGYADDAAAFIRAEDLGPDALDPGFDLARFEALLARRRSDVKAALMDQSRIAGIGNVYADEILFQAGLHPKTRCDGMEPERVAELFRQMRRVLETAIARRAGSERFLDRLPAGYLLPHRAKGGSCPRCGEAIDSLKVGGRTTCYCPRCQKLTGGSET